MGLFKNLSKTSQIMIKSSSVICLILIIAGLPVINLIYYFRDYQIEKNLPFIAGILLGYVSTVIRIIMLEKSLKSTINAGNKKKAQNIWILLYTVRLLFTGAVLALAFLFPYIFGPVGTVAGILSMQVSAFIANIFLTK